MAAHNWYSWLLTFHKLIQYPQNWTFHPAAGCCNTTMQTSDRGELIINERVYTSWLTWLSSSVGNERSEPDPPHGCPEAASTPVFCLSCFAHVSSLHAQKLSSGVPCFTLHACHLTFWWPWCVYLCLAVLSLSLLVSHNGRVAWWLHAPAAVGSHKHCEVQHLSGLCWSCAAIIAWVWWVDRSVAQQ